MVPRTGRRPAPVPVALLRDRGMQALLAVAVLGTIWYAWPVASHEVRVAAYWPIQVALDLVLAAGS